MGERVPVWWTILVALGGALHVGCESAQAPESIATSARAPVVAGPAPGWRDGERYVYTFSLSSGAELSGHKTMEFTLTSRALLDVRNVPGEPGTELAALLAEARIVAKDPDNQPQFDALALELARPFAFKLRDGVLAETRLPADTTAFAASIRRTLAALLQFAPQPNTASGDVWTAKETDPTGTYEAEYRRRDDGTVSKRKLRYDTRPLGQTRVGNFASMMPQVAKSTETLVLAEEPPKSGQARGFRLVRVELAEKVVNPLTAGASISSETSAQLALVQHSRPEPPFAWDKALAGSRVFRPDEKVGPQTPTSSYDDLRIGDYTFASALKELEAQGRDPKANDLFDKVRGQSGKPDELNARETRLKAQARVFTAMVGILRSQPEHVPDAVARIHARSTAARALIDALSSAGTPPAQRALVQMMEDEHATQPVRRTAAFALTRTPAASEETIAALSRQVDNDLLRVYALYGLGTLSRHLAEAGELARSEAITEILVAALKKADTASRRVDALRGIANSGAASAFPSVQPFLQAEDLKVRVAAIDAIRLMHRPDVDPILATALDTGANEVRIAAVEAASVREPSTILARSLESLAATTDRPQLRLKLVRVMGGWLRARPELKAPLQKFAQGDASEEVRLAAQNALGS